jgi:hypothetical protein
MEQTTKGPDLYLQSLPEGVREPMSTLDSALREVMIGHSRTLWEGVFWGGSFQSIIGYGEDRYTRSDGQSVDWFMVGLAKQKNHFSVYINAVQNGTYAVAQYADRLGKVKLGSSSIGFKKLGDIDMDALLELVELARKQLDNP